MSKQPARSSLVPDRLTPRLARVGLVDGTWREGRVLRFAPHEPDLILEIGASEGQSRRISLASERISHVAFLRPAQGPARRRERERVVRRVHLPGGQSLLVEAPEAAFSRPLGFFAAPHEPGSPYEELFFYVHGINRIENPELLGSMLVAEGLIAPRDLERGLATLSARRGRRPVTTSAVAPGTVADAGALPAADADETLIELEAEGPSGAARLGDVLVELQVVSEKELARTLARKFNLPFVDLDERVVDPAIVGLVEPGLLVRLGALPLEADERSITVAIGDPLATDATDQLRAATRKQIREVVVTRSQLRAHLEHLGASPRGGSTGDLEQILRELGAEQAAMERTTAGRVEVRENDNAIIRLANQIIVDAHAAGASDIHLEPNGREQPMAVRFRVDGDCVEYRPIPPELRKPLIARLKIMASLDITERRRPQDGKIQLTARDRQLELRVATIPTVNDNEDVVLRLLAGARPLPLDRIGLSARNLGALRTLITRPHGLVLCVGPTGSGKTTTLHSILGVINTVDMKIWTVEDPVEITQEGLRQVQMNEKKGVTFATALRAFLRADPDVIMVGEMRDEETARIAVEASLTGHLVLSTLHTNSAPETVTRLLDIGLEPFGFGDALLGVLAQRLVRGLCPSCKTSYPASKLDRDGLARYYGEAELAALLGAEPRLTLHRASGCAACKGTGYKGRLALHELLVNDDVTRPLIQRRAPAGEIRRAAAASGMKTMVQDGVEKLVSGLIDLRQLTSVAVNAS